MTSQWKMMHSENVKSRIFCWLQTLSMSLQGVTMCDRERQGGLEHFICFEQNGVEADRFMLIFFFYLGKHFITWQKIIITGNYNQLWKQPHHLSALTLVLWTPRAKSRSFTASLRDSLLFVVAVSLASLQTWCQRMICNIHSILCTQIELTPFILQHFVINYWNRLLLEHRCQDSCTRKRYNSEHKSQPCVQTHLVHRNICTVYGHTH